MFAFHFSKLILKGFLSQALRRFNFCTVIIDAALKCAIFLVVVLLVSKCLCPLKTILVVCSTYIEVTLILFLFFTKSNRRLIFLIVWLRLKRLVIIAYLVSFNYLFSAHVTSFFRCRLLSNMNGVCAQKGIPWWLMPASFMTTISSALSFLP